jgi:putative transposase
MSRVLREEFPHLRSRRPTLWSTMQRYIDLQYERPWCKEKTS